MFISKILHKKKAKYVQHNLLFIGQYGKTLIGKTFFYWLFLKKIFIIYYIDIDSKGEDRECGDVQKQDESKSHVRFKLTSLTWVPQINVVKHVH